MQTKKTILSFTASSLLAATLATAPLSLDAQETTTNAPPMHKHTQHDHSVFNGRLAALDKNAQTLKVGERTFEINSETKITKAGKPATLSDGVVGEPVAGAYKKSDDGKMIATSIRFGVKPESEKKKKKQTSPDNTGTTTNSVPN
jgi:hypothetical protein